MTANLSRLLTWNRYRNHDKAALVHGSRSVSYGQLDDRVHALAAALSEVGAGPGAVVAVLAGNSIEFVETILAISKLGAILLPLNVRLHPEELAHTMANAGCRILVTEAEYREQAEASLVSLGGGSRLATLAGPGWPGCASLEERRDANAGARVADAEVGLDDPQRILYTSGTTGHPKGVVITHGNVIFNHLGQALELGMRADDRILMSAPIYHVSGMDGPGFATLYLGASWVVTRDFSATGVLELIVSERITGLVLAAPILVGMLNHPERARYDLGGVRFVIFGSLPPAAFLQVQDLFPNAHLADVFGMTETTNGTSYLDRLHARSKPASQGAGFPCMDFDIQDETGASLAPDTPGELAWRGPKVSPGYWGDPAATARSRRNGWLLTGDVARVDAEGYLWFLDRMKDMIKSGGENIASAEIERVLLDHPLVVEAAVIGVPDERWGEVPKAFVVTRSPVQPEAIRDHCARHLGRFKVPKYVEVLDSLPRNVSGKVIKRDLRELGSAAGTATAAKE